MYFKCLPTQVQTFGHIKCRLGKYLFLQYLVPREKSPFKELTRQNVTFPLSATNLLGNSGTSQCFHPMSQRPHLERWRGGTLKESNLMTHSDSPAWKINVTHSPLQVTVLSSPLVPGNPYCLGSRSKTMMCFAYSGHSAQEWHVAM